jgi:hypothetical protein
MIRFGSGTRSVPTVRDDILDVAANRANSRSAAVTDIPVKDTHWFTDLDYLPHPSTRTD